MDAARYTSAVLGMSAVLTATLADVSNVDIPDSFDVLKADFASLIASQKTKFALASAATAIGNNELMLLQDVDLPLVSEYAIETLLTASLCSYYTEPLQPFTVTLDSMCESEHKYSK